MNTREEPLKFYVWNINHWEGETSGLILYAATCAHSADEARGKLLREKNLAPEMVEMIRHHSPTEKTSLENHTATWDLRDREEERVRRTAK